MTLAIGHHSKKDRLKSPGSAQTGICPRRGYAYLKTNHNELLALPTTCKSWSCKSCQTRKNNMVTATIAYGLYNLEWLLISVTYVAQGNPRYPAVNPVNAASARKDWLALLMRLKRDQKITNLIWLQVMELTKRKQLHRHILMHFDGIKTIRPDCGSISYEKRLRNSCTCFNCYMVRAWYTITGDSFVVDVKRVYSGGVAPYLTKYLAKSMRGDDREIMANRGIKRLWSCSRNWIRGSKMQRRGTLDKAWVSHSFGYGEDRFSKLLAKTSKGHWALEQVGTNLAKRLYQDKEFARYAHIYETLRSNRHHGRSRRLPNGLANTC